MEFSQLPAFANDDFEWNLPEDHVPRSKDEIEIDINYFITHPLNAKKITPEMLLLPEYQALQSLVFDGSPEDVARNFMKQGYDRLNKVLMKESKNNAKEIDEAIYCFDQGLD